MSVHQRLSGAYDVQRGAVSFRLLDVPGRSVLQRGRVVPRRCAMHLEHRLRRRELLQHKLGFPRWGDVRALLCLLRVQRHRLRGLHVERSMFGGPSLRFGLLRSLFDRQSMRPERQVHADAYDVGVHLHGQRRLRVRRSVRLRSLHTRLQLEPRLPIWLCVRGRRLRQLRVQHSMRLRFNSELPERFLLVLDFGRLSDRTRL